MNTADVITEIGFHPMWLTYPLRVEGGRLHCAKDTCPCGGAELTLNDGPFHARALVDVIAHHTVEARR